LLLSILVEALVEADWDVADADRGGGGGDDGGGIVDDEADWDVADVDRGGGGKKGISHTGTTSNLQWRCR
jgi:hypothetical protein